MYVFLAKLSIPTANRSATSIVVEGLEDNFSEVEIPIQWLGQ